MHSHPKHTIHRGHIHHGWNNAFKPVLTAAPGDTIHFETKDASSGQLSKSSTAAELAKLDLAFVNPVTGPVTDHFDKKGYEVTTGIGPDLMTGARTAVSEMVELLSRRYGYEPIDAYMLCLSLIHISEPTRLLSISYAV